MNVLFTTTAGLGNQIQQTQMYISLCHGYKTVDIAIHGCSEDTAKYFACLAEYHGNKCMMFKPRNPRPSWWDAYDRVYCLLGSPYNTRKLAYECRLPHIGNEVYFYEHLFKLTSIPRIDCLPINWKMFRPRKRPPKYDVIICNGSRNNYSWIKKRYQRWNEVIKPLLKNYSVACVGMPDEYIPGCADLTGIGILETLDAIDRCKVFASNDTGLYHFANVIGKPNVVIFTATDTLKNCQEDGFHKYATVLQPTLDCCPCQSTESWSRTTRWQECEDWKCTYFDPGIVTEQILERLRHG